MLIEQNQIPIRINDHHTRRPGRILIGLISDFYTLSLYRLLDITHVSERI